MLTVGSARMKRIKVEQKYYNVVIMKQSYNRLSETKHPLNSLSSSPALHTHSFSFPTNPFIALAPIPTYIIYHSLSSSLITHNQLKFLHSLMFSISFLFTHTILAVVPNQLNHSSSSLKAYNHSPNSPSSSLYSHNLSPSPPSTHTILALVPPYSHNLSPSSTLLTQS